MYSGYTEEFLLHITFPYSPFGQTPLARGYYVSIVYTRPKLVFELLNTEFYSCWSDHLVTYLFEETVTHWLETGVVAFIMYFLVDFKFSNTRYRAHELVTSVDYHPIALL